ncbi:MAG TPA: 6-hydroxymethylpterin diphosphokinase MptE-like protein [Burkholderiales bacterium]|jgi:hypothetical protein|nr:6-hydroxymethylpterin diphosphokinase MptE-like protein [Burkholderiales bacterium]
MDWANHTEQGGACGQDLAAATAIATPDLFSEQMRLIGRRWPALQATLAAQADPGLELELLQGRTITLRVQGIQLGSRHAPQREAQMQAAQLPDAEVLYLYGPGLGELPQHLLQTRTRLRRLEVRILHAGLFTRLLHLVDHSAWLGDPRIHLALAGEDDEVRLPFFAHPGDLSLVDDASVRIRDRLIAELTLPFIRQTFSAGNPLLAQRLAQNGALLAGDGDVAELFGTMPGRRAFIIGTGPTLEQHLSLLAQVAQAGERPLLIAADTALAPLARVGVHPDIAVACDYRIEARHLAAGANGNTALVYAPLIAGEVIRAWNGPRYAAYSASPIYDRVRGQLPKASLFEGGSVIHPAIDLAVKMGSRSITLFGTDFCFPNGKTHAHWPAGALRADLDAAQHWVLNCRGERVVTNHNFSTYLVELERYIKRQPAVRFFQTSRDGARIAGCAEHPEYMK